MNNFQVATRNEINMLQERMAHIENLAERISQIADVINTSYKSPFEINLSAKDNIWEKVIGCLKVLFQYL